MQIQENETAEVVALSPTDFKSNLLNLTGTTNNFLQRINELIPYAVSIHIDGKEQNADSTKRNHIYTILSRTKNLDSAFASEGALGLYLNFISNTQNNSVIITSFDQKNNDFDIKTFINQIKITEILESSKKALHHVYDFLFTAIKKKDFNSIHQLISDKDVLNLKTIYLIAIISIAYDYKEKIEGFDIFFESVRTKAKTTMEPTDFELTFADFD